MYDISRDVRLVTDFAAGFGEVQPYRACLKNFISVSLALTLIGRCGSVIWLSCGSSLTNYLKSRDRPEYLCELVVEKKKKTLN